MISILLATYNGEKYIEKCIKSIQSQTYIDWELLIGLNDCTDDTINIIKSFDDNRIKIFEYTEKGKAKTLNKLTMEASFDWICIIDDDDMWVNTKLEEQTVFFESNYDVIGTQMYYCDSDGSLSNAPRLELYDLNIKTIMSTGSNQIANLSVMIKKSSLVNVGGWNENLLALEDFDLWIRMIKQNYRFFNIDKKLSIHRKHSDSKFNSINNSIQEEIKNKILSN